MNNFPHHIFSAFIDNLQAIVEHGGYTLLFITSILEGIPLLGAVIPGQTIIILGGFFAKIGVLKLTPVIIYGTLGAIIGDALSFELGRKYGYAFLDKVRSYLSIKVEHIEKAKAVIATHTGKAIIIGRFNPLTRTLTSFLVGASGAHIKKFWFYDIIGCVTWAVSSVLIGYIFGAGYETAAGYFGKFVLAGIIIALLILWAYRFINSRWHIFVRYDIFTLALVILSLYATFETIQDAVGRYAPMIHLDIAINLWMTAHIVPAITEIMKYITHIFSPTVFSLVALVAIVGYGWKKKWQQAALIAISFGGITFWTWLLKELIERTRPITGLISETGYSFPSGHAAFAACAGVVAVYLYCLHIKNLHMRELAITAIVLTSFLIAFTRIYLGVHWFSDIVAGYALGVFAASFAVLFIKYLSALVKPIRVK
ncbi:MAG: hypothetical protein RIT04_466 [Candidatus Parcubacteria bacterium]